MGYSDQSFKRIGIDVRMWRHAGIGRYISQLVPELLKNNPGHEFIFFGGRDILESIDTLRSKPVMTRQLGSPIYSIGEQLEFPAKTFDLNLLHSPHFNIPIRSRSPLIVTIHDLIYLHYPQVSRSRMARAYTTFLFTQVVKKAAAIITVSEYTKRDLLGRFPSLSQTDIFVTPEAAAPYFKKIRDDDFLKPIKQRLELERPFVLFVGSFLPHKNISTLVRAVDRLRRTRAFNHELVLVGKRDGRDKALEKLIQTRSFVRCLGQLSDRDMLAVYNMASVFVLPSLLEGFGLPILEAMACGVPVIASQRSSMPEVGGEAADYFDPESVDELEHVLATVLSNQSHRERMINRGFLQIKNFSWEKTALRTLEAYRSVLS